MAGKFLLRTKGDTENPILPRLYDLGITTGLSVFYLRNASGNRTGFIAFLSEGARFIGDTGCDRVIKVLYAGFELPEFDTAGNRNWKFHPGTIPTAPTYKACTMTNAGDLVLSNTHGYVNDQLVAFRTKGLTARLPLLPGGGRLESHKQYVVKNATTNNFTLENVGGGAVVFDGDSVGDTFVYAADGVGLFDEDQGIPTFFPSLKQNFAGIAYLEILVPAELSDGEDEPTKLKVKMDGKLVFDFEDDGDGGLVPVGDPIPSRDPAQIAFDVLKNDGDFEADRFGATTWAEWRDRNQASIPWVGGASTPAFPASFPTMPGAFTYDAERGILTHTGTVRDIAATASIPAQSNASLEVQYRGGDIHLRFASAAAVELSVTHALVCNNDVLYYTNNGVNFTIIGEAVNSDRLKIEFNGGVFQAYRNGIPLSLTDVTVPPQPDAAFYISILVATDGTIVRDILIAPSGTPGVPRQVTRFTGGAVLQGKVPIGDVLENEVALCGGVSWQDVDGKIEILERPDRAAVVTFNADPNSSLPTNCSSIKIKRRDPRSAPNYYRFSVRDRDDEQLTKKYDFVDRPLRRASVGYIDSGIIEYGVITVSQGQRLTETKARLSTDLDVSWTIEAFLDNLQAAKGNFCYVVDPTSGYTESAPALGMIVSEKLVVSGDVETRVFEVNQITNDFYDDTAHGAVVPLQHNHVGAQYLPPPILTSLTLTESSRTVDGAGVPVIDALAVFDQWSGQRGRVFYRSFSGETAQVDFTNATDFLTGTTDYSTAVLATFVGELVSVFPISGGAMPEGLSSEVAYEVVDEGGGDFSLLLDSDPVTFTTDGSGDLRVALYATWRLTDRVLFPNASSLEAPFSIDAVERGIHQVRVVSESLAGVSLAFGVHRTSFIEVVGDLTAPEPPTALEAVYDGINLNWRWQPSPSLNVAGYYITDGEGRIVQQFNPGLGFSETVRTLMTARRVYAVSRLGVRSVTAAALDFILPPMLEWIDPVGGDIIEFGVFRKTTADGWDAGASFSWSVLTPAIAASFRTPPVTETDTMRCFGFTRDGGGGAPFVTENEQFSYGVQLNADGTVLQIALDDGVFVSSTVGTYEVGDEFIIEFEPPVSPSDPSVVKLYQITTVDGVRVQTMIHLYGEYTQFFPMFGSIAAYTQDVRITPYLTLTGALIPTEPTNPTWRDFSATPAYLVESNDGTILTVNGGASQSSVWTTDIFESYEDGIFEFSFDNNIHTSVGLSLDDPDVDITNINLAVEHVDDNTVNVLIFGVFVEEILAPGGGVGGGAGVKFSLSRENGVCCIRRNGRLVYTADAADTQIYPADTPSLAVFADAGQNGLRVLDITARQARPTHTEFLGDKLPVTATVRTARAGEQSVYEIPLFNVTDPVDGELLRYNAGRLVNTSVVGSLVGGAGIDGGVLYQSGAGLTQSSNFTFLANVLNVPSLVSTGNINTSSGHSVLFGDTGAAANGHYAFFRSGHVGRTSVVMRGIASQTNPILDVQDSATNAKLQVYNDGTVKGATFVFDQGNGRFAHGTATAQSASFWIQNIWTTTQPTMVVRNIASQTADSLQIQNSAGQNLVRTDYQGTTTFRNNVSGSDGRIVLQTGANPEIQIHGDLVNGYYPAIVFHSAGVHVGSIHGYGGIFFQPQAGYTVNSWSNFANSPALTLQASSAANVTRTSPTLQSRTRQRVATLRLWENGTLEQIGSYGSYARPLVVPVLTSVTASGSGGTLPTGTYYYKVTACNIRGESIGSNELSVAITLGQNAVLNWTISNGDGIDHYKVYRATSSGGYTATSWVTNDPTTGVPFYTLSFTDTGYAGVTGQPKTAITDATMTYRRWDGQTGELIRFENESGTKLAGINPDGSFETTVVKSSTTLRIGSGSGNALFVDAANLVACGHASPSAQFHVIKSSGTQVRVGRTTLIYCDWSIDAAGGSTFTGTGSSPAFTFANPVTFSDGLIIADNKHIQVGTTTGTTFATSASQKLGFWGVAPVVQSPGWTASPASGNTTFDPASGTYAELMDYVATLVQELKTYGLLG